MSVGKSVRLFLADGTPGGLLTAEIMNWTGHIVAAPRSDLASILKRPETSRTGVYILIGDDPDSPGGVFAYIGEGDDVGKRLYQHARPEAQSGKDFWDRAIVLTSKDANLTKAHARYLESRLIALAHEAQRARLVNSTAPEPIQLPEADLSDMEYFISQAKIVLPILGVNIFRTANTEIVPSRDVSGVRPNIVASPLFELRLKAEALVAKAQEIDGEFTVLEGSQARSIWTGAESGYQRLHEKLQRDGTLERLSDGAPLLRFARNQVFASPSAAAAIITGRQANGRVEWKLGTTSKTYGRWQEESVEQAAAGVGS